MINAQVESESEDLDVQPIESEAEDRESSPVTYQISTYPTDFTLEGLNNKLVKNEIIIPNYQRQFVWTIKQASKLIESFLIGLPVPSIFLYKEHHSNRFQLLDGQQRLKSVSYFFEGYFGEEKNRRRLEFRLEGLNKKSPYFEKKFIDLNEVDQGKLKDSVLRAFVIQQLNPKDVTSIYHIFERLNSGGTYLNNQEIRNCVYHGTLNEALKSELNLYANWRKILNKPKPDTRMIDVELILRAISLIEYEKYTDPMKDYLSVFLEKNRNLDSSEIDRLKKLFYGACDTIVASLGEKPFRVYRNFNVAAFDCVIVAIMRNLDNVSQIKNLSERYERLVSELIESGFILSATTNIETVKERMKMAEFYLFDVTYVDGAG